MKFYRIETEAGVSYIRQDTIIEIKVNADHFYVEYASNSGTYIQHIRASTAELSKTYSMEEILKMEGVK